MPCRAWKCVPTAFSSGVAISKVPAGVIVTTERVTKNYFNNWCLLNPWPTFLYLTYFWLNELVILSKACKPDNFESHNFSKLGFSNIEGLCLNFVECEFFLESNSPEILLICEKKLR